MYAIPLPLCQTATTQTEQNQVEVVSHYSEHLTTETELRNRPHVKPDQRSQAYNTRNTISALMHCKLKHSQFTDDNVNIREGL